MGSLLRLLVVPGLLLLALAAAEWLRGPLYEGEFGVDNLSDPPVVRVGLNDALNVPFVDLRVEGPVQVLDPAGREVFWEGPGLDAKVVPVPAPGPGIRLGDTLPVPLDEVLLFPARDGTLRIGKIRYRGTLRLRVREATRRLDAINELGLERYLQGVITSEMRAHWPPEALRAQAVVARTYAAYEIRSGYTRSKRGFDVFDDDNSQAYRGVSGETPEAIEAVQATYGVVLRFDGRLFKTFYQNTCGGRTESAQIVFDEQPIPPLAGRECAYCSHSKHFRWKVEVQKADLAARLYGNKEAADGLTARILEKTPGGLALKVVVQSPRGGERPMSGRDFRSAVGSSKLQSLAFDVTDAGDRLVIDGRGWGHLVGLCQEGARGFAEAHPEATYRDILQYYYPGATAGRAH